MSINAFCKFTVTNILIDKVIQWKQGGSFAQYKYIKSGFIDNICTIILALLYNLFFILFGFFIF